MESQLTCRGCDRRLPGHQAAFVGSPSYNLWARESYCSYFCFRTHAPPDLVERDEEIENQRQESIATVDLVPERVEPVSVVEELTIASFGIRIFARLLDTVSAGVLVYFLARLSADLLVAGEEAPRAAHWYSRTVLAQPWSRWQVPVFYVVGSFLYFTLCHWIAGTTPFKFLVGVAVVREGGKRCSFLGALIREIVYIFDAVFLGIVAFVCVAIGEQKQRLGDFAAHTLVVEMATSGGRGRYVGPMAFATLFGMASWLGLGLLWGGFGSE